MEGIMKKRPLLPISARPAAMAVHRASHAISKPNPKIRIIHIFAPEIIKTDVANFRDLVQRLTGKPTTTATDKKKENPAEIPAPAVAIPAFDRKPEIVDIAGGGFRRVIKKEDEEDEEEEEEELNDVVGMWNDVVGFSDFEGFIEELGEFPLLPSAHQIMNGFEETTQFA